MREKAESHLKLTLRKRIQNTANKQTQTNEEGDNKSVWSPEREVVVYGETKHKYSGVTCK